MNCDVGEATEVLENELLILPFPHFTYVKTHSPTLLLLHLCHSLFSNLSVTLPTSQLILQPFHHFTYVTAHSSTILLLHLHQSSFSNPSFASPTSQALHLIHLVSLPCCSFSNPSVASPTSQFILQLFFRFSYITSSSLNSPGKSPMVNR